MPHYGYASSRRSLCPSVGLFQPACARFHLGEEAPRGTRSQGCCSCRIWAWWGAETICPSRASLAGASDRGIETRFVDDDMHFPISRLRFAELRYFAHRDPAPLVFLPCAGRDMAVVDTPSLSALQISWLTAIFLPSYDTAAAGILILPALGW
jgi:hypothetical protein